jgi:hypothetical protein
MGDRRRMMYLYVCHAMSLNNLKSYFLRDDGPCRQLSKTVEIAPQGHHMTLKVVEKVV